MKLEAVDTEKTLLQNRIDTHEDRLSTHDHRLRTHDDRFSKLEVRGSGNTNITPGRFDLPHYDGT